MPNFTKKVTQRNLPKSHQKAIPKILDELEQENFERDLQKYLKMQH